jgi:hypothetical protein
MNTSCCSNHDKQQLLKAFIFTLFLSFLMCCSSVLKFGLYTKKSNN